MATITQIVAAQTPKPPCNTCGHRPRAGSLETTPSPVSRTSSYTAVSVPPTVTERPLSPLPEPPVERTITRSVSRTPILPAPSRWRRTILAVKAGLHLGRKDG